MEERFLVCGLVCKKTSLSIFLEQFLAVLNLNYLRRMRLSKNAHLIASPQHPIPAFCSDHTRTRCYVALGRCEQRDYAPPRHKRHITLKATLRTTFSRR